MTRSIRTLRPLWRAFVSAGSTQTAHRLSMLLIFSFLVVLWASQVSGTAVDTDAAANVRMAVNLRHNGVISLDAASPHDPSMYREPLPVFVISISVAAVDAIMGPAPAQEYLSGKRVRALKYQNVVWMALLSVAVLLSVHAFTGSHYLALLAVVLTSKALPLMPSGLGVRGLRLDDLFTELDAAALLTCGSLLIAVGLRHRRLALLVAAGVVFGLLALVKASFLYIFIGLVATLPILHAILQRDRGRIRTMVEVGVLSLAFAGVVSPWMVRNQINFGEFQISERGGLILYTRAIKDSMTADEYRASFYYWAPRELRSAVGHMLGLGRADFQEAGRYRRLNSANGSDFHARDMTAEESGRPDEAISFFRQARAERVHLARELGRAGSQNALGEADDVLMQRAIAMIRGSPGRHLALTMPFLWRGAFIPFPVLLLGLSVAVWARRPDLLAYLLPSLGAVMFHALATHYIPRFSLPMVPVCIVAAAVTSSWLFAAIRNRVWHPEYGAGG